MKNLLILTIISLLSLPLQGQQIYELKKLKNGKIHRIQVPQEMKFQYQSVWNAHNVTGITPEGIFSGQEKIFPSYTLFQAKRKKQLGEKIAGGVIAGIGVGLFIAGVATLAEGNEDSSQGGIQIFDDKASNGIGAAGIVFGIGLTIGGGLMIGDKKKYDPNEWQFQFTPTEAGKTVIENR